MQQKILFTMLALAAALFTGCDKVDKPRSSAASAVSAAATHPPAPPTLNQGIEIPLQFTGKTHPPEFKSAQFDFTGGMLKVASSGMVDAHLLSEPVVLNASETYIIRGQVKGTDLKTSKAPYAAGIGLLGEKMVVDFPAGTFDWTPFEATFTTLTGGPRTISVGLGGWKNGQGTLEVKDMKLFK